MYSVNDLYNYCVDNNLTLFPTRDYPFMKKYNDNTALYDFRISDLFCDRYIKGFDGTVPLSVVHTIWTKKADSVLTFDFWKFSKLYDTTLLEYNPIENYNRVEHSSTDTNGSNTKSGSVENSGHNMKNGTVSEAEKNGNYTENNTSLVSPYDNNDFANKDKSIKEVGEVTKNTTTTYNNLQDVSNDTTTYNALKDTSTNNNTTDSTISGNIGVTTSQQMIEAERKVVDFNFFMVIATEVIENNCLNYWEEGL